MPPSPTPPPTTNATPTNHVVGNGVAGNVYISNASEIYGPIVQALNAQKAEDELDPGDGTTVGADFNTGGNPVNQAADNKKWELDGKLQAGQGKVNSTRSTITSKLATIQPITLPTVTGSQFTFPVTLPLLGSLTIDLTPYSSVIGVMRALLLMVALVGAWFASIKIIRSGIA
jgi:hypothetical protein